MRLLSILLFVSLALYSCGENAEKPKVDYNQTEATPLTIEDAVSDTTKTMVATLPLSFDSTNVLLQPSGLVNIKDIKNSDFFRLDKGDYASSMRKDKYEEPDFYANGIYNDVLSGQISNIYFDDLATNTQTILTKDYISISRVMYQRQIAKNVGRHYLLYFVYDKDTNRDGKLDSDDILSLYISNLNGTGFTKVTRENQELSDRMLLERANRYYFTTIEDVNKDGHFDKGDKYNYYYIDFSADPYRVVEYNPTGL